MRSFVRRMMPTPEEALDDLEPFVDFLEKRLEALADRFNLTFIAADDPDLINAALAQRGFSQEVIDQAREAGTSMQLFHYTSAEPPMSLTSSYGVTGASWHDTAFLNSTPGNMYYLHSGEDYGYNLLVDLPEGAGSIKTYGLHYAQNDVAAAETAIAIANASSPEEAKQLIEDALSAARGGPFARAGSKHQAAGEMQIDQFSRVFEADPRLVRQMRQIIGEWTKKRRADLGFKAGAVRGSADWTAFDEIDEILDVMRFADELGDMRVSTTIGDWTTETANASVLAERVANSSYKDRLEYGLWLQRFRGFDPAVEETYADVLGMTGWHGDKVFTSPERLSESFAQFLWAKDPDLNPSDWALAAAETVDDYARFGSYMTPVFTGHSGMHGDRLNYGAFDWEGMLESPSTAGRGGGHRQLREPEFHGPELPDKSLRRWYLTQFYEKYQNSLAADGYTGAFWLNTSDAAFLEDGSFVHGLATPGDAFPNFVAVNPAALRSADVRMTHRNISRIAGEGDVKAADWAGPARQDVEDEAIRGMTPDPLDYDSVTADPYAVVSWQTVKNDKSHPFWDLGGGNQTALDLEDEGVSVAEIMADLEDRYINDYLQDPTMQYYSDEWIGEHGLTGDLKPPDTTGFPDYRKLGAMEQAQTGETRFIEPAAFFEWFQNISMSPKTVLGNEAVPNVLEDLVARRAALVADQQLAAATYRETAGQMLSEVDLKAAREAIELGTPPDSWIADLADTERWLVSRGMDEKQRQIDEALDLLDRLGAPVDTPLEDLPDDLIELRLAVGALVEGDNAMLNLALDEFQRGAEGWTDLISKLPDQKLGDLHKVPKAEEMIEDIFLSGMKEFGRLQGNATLVDSMLATETFAARGGAAGFLSKYDKLHNLLRAYMIAKPGFHGRNFLSGAFMNHLAGIDWSSYRKFMRAYWKYQEEEAAAAGLTKKAARMRKAMRGRFINPENVSQADVEVVRELARTGSLGSASGQVASEFVESSGRGIIARRLAPNANIRIGGKEVNIVDAMNPMNTRNAPLRLSKNFGMATETFLRGSLGFDTLKKGGTASEAFDNIMKFHFDYDDLSDFERNVVKRVVPFYTWTRKNMPLMMEQFARQPEVFNRYVSLKKEVELMSEDDEGGIVPRWMQRQGAIRLPFKYEGENMMILPDMPFKAPLELLDPALAFDADLGIMERVEIALGTLGTQITPIIKAPYEWKAKQNLWKGYSFDGRPEAVPGAYTIIPGMMEGLRILGIASKNYEGDWVMPDHALHGMAQLLPTFTDYRRLFPDEEKYQQRAVSNWISWLSGIGLRTNTKWEQQQEIRSRGYDMREERAQERALRRSRL